MTAFEELLSGSNLRSIGKVNDVISRVHTQHDFDQLFNLLYNDDRIVAMRAADAIEKITVQDREFLLKHSGQILSLCRSAMNKEFKWHLAQLLPRLFLNQDQLTEARLILHNWAANKGNSRIVRVNALQGLFDLTDNKEDLQPFLTGLEEERVPSINARIRRLNKLTGEL